MIDYRKIADAVDFYKSQYFQYIETPWTVSPEVDDITKPADRIHMQLKHNDKCLVGSGEQSFLYLYCKGYLPPGCYQTVTPCWRYEHYDGMHAKCFMKNELINTACVDRGSLDVIIGTAKAFFDKYLETEVVKTDIGYDIVSREGKFELGSYGIRHTDYIDWVYGTGCAEPRLSRVIESINLKNKYKNGINNL